MTRGEYKTTAHERRPKLTPEQREEIGFRRMEGERVWVLAAEYGVSASYINASIPPRERP